ncbi:MAG: helix-turn-helix domain-containing protein [Rhodococcus sp. (in: high G+C Gram-positive bacteria)]
MTSDDLSTLADAAAAATGGAVSIMDSYGYVIAYSSVPGQPIDEVRRDGILGKRVPEKYLVHHRDATFRSERTVRVVDVAGTLPRLAIAVGSGKDHLGSIWSIVPDGLSGSVDSEAAAALTRAAESAAPLMLARTSPTSGGNDRILALLDESVTVRDAHYVVLAAVVPSPHPNSVLEQLAGLLELVLARGPDSGSVIIDGSVYLLRAVQSADELDTADFDDRVETARLRASASLEVPVTIVISDPHRSPLAAREQVRRVLEVVGDEARSVRRRDVAPRIALSDIGKAFTARPLNIPAVEAMRAHDAAEGTSYADTVLALLEHESNVALASTSIYLHANTFRYRLRRAKELFGLDLDDADTRLLVWLTLRLGREQLSGVQQVVRVQ